MLFNICHYFDHDYSYSFLISSFASFNFTVIFIFIFILVLFLFFLSYSLVYLFIIGYQGRNISVSLSMVVIVTLLQSPSNIICFNFLFVIFHNFFLLIFFLTQINFEFLCLLLSNSLHDPILFFEILS